MPEIDRLSGPTEWIDLEFVERERTPEFAIQVGIQLHLAGLSLSNTKQYLEKLGVERSRTAIHDWVRKDDLQPDSDVEPNQSAVDETMIRVNGQRHWLYAAVDPGTNQFLHIRLFQTRTTQLTLLFLRELREKQHRNDVTFLIDAATHLKAALNRLGLRFRVCRHGNRNAIERVFREVKRRTSSFSNTFSNAQLPIAESWLQAFAVWWNQC
ncbi:IS6 family transposase [Salinigranum salinum]|uniref:IS6 family transposase n=1 Tax=Salinigranum salinum TaxID=1364937 RepID=UPI00126085EA|nr:IS6 family transposase [Salinigranum salinum]